MAQKQMDVQIRPVAITGPGVAHWTGDGMIHVPDEIHAEVMGLPWEVTFTVRPSEDDDMSPDITDLHIRQRPGGEPLGADLLRAFRLGDARDQAVAKAASRWELNPATGKLQLDWDSVPKYLTKSVTKRSQRRVTDDVVRQAADTYLEAKRLGRRDHLMAIAEACHVSRATAHRYLNRAIEAGLVPKDD